MPGRVPIDDDLPPRRCGLFAIWGPKPPAHLLGLALQPGQESAGIVVSDGERFRLEKGMGLVNDVFTDERMDRLVGDKAMGHVRYSTAGDTVAANAQPILIECHRGPIALAHNGNLVNAAILRHELEAAGSIFQSTSDTEVILHLYARSHRDKLEDAIAASLSGDGPLLFLTKDGVVAARDWGFRAGAGRPGRRPHRLRDLRPRPHRCRVRAGRRAGRAVGDDRDGRAPSDRSA
jgi:amidophosphoribosyltransferase